MTGARYEQVASLGLALVVAQEISEGLALARSLGAESSAESVQRPPEAPQNGAQSAWGALLVH